MTRTGSRRSVRPAARASVRPSGRQARRPGRPLRSRLGRRLPSLSRVLALLGAGVLVVGLGVLLTGPWLVVDQVAWSGQRYTGEREIARLVTPAEGGSVLAVDTRLIEHRMEQLPAVDDARVEATLPGSLVVTLTEKEPAFVWKTSASLLVGAADGTLIGSLPRDGRVPPDLRLLPVMTDARSMARLIIVGDTISDELLTTALLVAGLDPALLGSSAERVTVRIDDEFGFMLVAADPGWSIALGFLGHQPNGGAESVAEQVEHRAAAVRTLFAAEDEREIEWVDARNPGKVYFRARG